MQLSRERIITAAVRLIEREGVDAVSMRRIATELGSGVMSLYNHVPSKAALLDGVAERVISGIEVTSEHGTGGEAGPGWADEIRAQARAFRQIARAYPRCTMIAVSRPTVSTTEPPPVEHALATLRGAGFGEDDAVRIVRAFVAYAVGSLLREVGVSPSVVRQQQPEPAPFADTAPLDPDTALPHPDTALPHPDTALPAAAGPHPHRDHDADFEFGLDLLVRAVAGLRPPVRH